jgi:hypothetical protein
MVLVTGAGAASALLLMMGGIASSSSIQTEGHRMLTRALRLLKVMWMISKAIRLYLGVWLQVDLVVAFGQRRRQLRAGDK